VLDGNLDLARGNPEQRLAVDHEPGQRGRRYTGEWLERDWPFGYVDWGKRA
jgi:hypothetical protein